MRLTLESVHKIQIGATQKTECFGNPWTFEKGIKSWNSSSETCHILSAGHIPDRIAPPRHAIGRCGAGFPEPEMGRIVRYEF